MHTITLTADDGTQHVGKLPRSWQETPLAPYAALATATTLPERIRALAALVGLPPEPLLHDVRHYGAMVKAAPFLFGELPEASAPVPSFKHLGTTYAHVGNLARVSGEQMEALTIFLRDSDGKPLTAGPGLLAVLYCPKGKEQTAEVVTATQQAFATLPVSIAWGAIASFCRSSGPVALNIRAASALTAQAQAALAALEQALTSTGSRTSFLSLGRKLGRMWIRRVRKTL